MKAEKKKRIEYLVEQIDELSSELRQLLLENEHPKEISKSKHKKEKKAAIGKRVKITVKYGGFYGEKGTIVGMTSFYLTIKLDSGSTIKKAKSSVEYLD
jgi:hypothetical protein